MLLENLDLVLFLGSSKSRSRLYQVDAVYLVMNNLRARSRLKQTQSQVHADTTGLLDIFFYSMKIHNCKKHYLIAPLPAEIGTHENLIQF